MENSGSSRPQTQRWQLSWQLFLRWINRRQGFIWRAGLACLIGIAMFETDEAGSFDARLQIRGNQKASDQIVLITIAANEMPASGRVLNTGYLGLKSLPGLNSIADGDLTDSFYWNLRIWSQLLQILLKENPKSVAVTLFFGEALRPAHWGLDEQKLFWDPRITWACLNSPAEGLLVPAFAKTEAQNAPNIAALELLRDQDGVIRRFPGHATEAQSDVPTIPEKISGILLELHHTPLINYRGDGRVYPEVSLTDVLTHNYPDGFFQNKIVLIGSESRATSEYLTPMGPSTRHAVIASQTDHLLMHRSVLRLPAIWYIFLLILIVLGTILVITRTPQAIAFVLIVGLLLGWSAMSIWLFDTLHFWLPILSTIGTMASAYVIFLGYQANKIEKKHFQLQQEQSYLQELEQLKNNFVSLISHDLKTPIAKIQAILDRMMLRPWEPDVQQDLQTLRQSNEELNQYIQSVLQMLRVESRDFRLHLEIGEINDVIQDAWLQLAPLADAKKLQITLDLEPMFSIEFDRTLIREVLINILDNSIKYCPPESQIHIRSTEVDDHVRVEIRDSGPGIPEAELDQIWRKFVRGKDQDLKTKGTGLGLYLVKFFIELHGGKVFIESELGRGTKIGFALPLASE